MNKELRKRAVSALRLWGSCQAVRTYSAFDPEKVRKARALEALGANPINPKSEGSRDEFQKLSLAQVVAGQPIKVNGKAYALPALCGVALGNRKAVVDVTLQGIKEGFGDSPHSHQPYANEAQKSEGAQLTFLLVDMALYGWEREFAFWIYGEGKQICNFPHAELKSARERYTASDRIIDFIGHQLEDQSGTIVSVWVDKLTKRLAARTWESGNQMLEVMFEELLAIEDDWLKSA